MDRLGALCASVLAAYLSNSPLVVHLPTTGSCVADGIGACSYSAVLHPPERLLSDGIRINEPRVYPNVPEID